MNKRFNHRVNAYIKKNNLNLSREICALNLAAEEIHKLALENIILNNLNVGDRIPFELYFNYLGIKCNTYEFFKNLNDKYFNKLGIIVELNIEEARREFFDYQINHIFPNVEKDDNFKENIYKVFCETLDIFIDKQIKIFEYVSDQDAVKISKFLNAIKNKSLQKGQGAGKYLMRVKHNIFIKRITSNEIYCRRLLVDDVDIIEYKLLVLSIFRFMDIENLIAFSAKVEKRFEYELI